MQHSELTKMISEIFSAMEGNQVHLPEEDVDIPILDAPVIGVASADDPLFDEMKKPKAVGEGWLSPREWLPEAESVIVLFFPYSEEVRRRHRAAEGPVDEAWKYAYGAGRALAFSFPEKLQSALAAYGVKACDPLSDPRMQLQRVPVQEDGEEGLHFVSAWSTRHAGFVAGLGTFGYHRHIITEKGCCGSLSTLITDLRLPPTPRQYTEVYEYCTGCGQCGVNCPSGAIAPGNSGI